MAGFRDFLMRFRLAGPPGRAAPGGVPADRSAELSAELEPPLSLLEQAEAEARAVREQAALTAEERRRGAEREAEEIVAQARARAEGVRAESADRVRRAAEAESAELLASAEREVCAVRRQAEARMPELVDRVSALVRAELDDPGGTAPAAPGASGAGSP
ncbi:hypothetical protein ACFY12_10770 [Streptomyces sp. NPDC001339]|uniref:hypothetical protein n=1 Tax=Streptomyces sp. NPDC001339 TaxID=3364563 RepID=UPI0036C3058B